MLATSTANLAGIIYRGEEEKALVGPLNERFFFAMMGIFKKWACTLFVSGCVAMTKGKPLATMAGSAWR